MTPTELRDRLDHAWDDEPPLPPVTDRLAAGHHALRRRRGRLAAGLGGVAVAAVAATVVLLPAGGDRPEPRGVDVPPATSPAPTPDATDLPVRAWPYADQGVEPMALWATADGRELVRSAGDVEVVAHERGVPIRDVRRDGQVVGHRHVYTVRWRGRTEHWYVEEVGGRYRGMGPTDDTSREPWYFQRVDGGYEIFRDPVGITADGRLDPRPGAVVSGRAVAGVYDDERFASMPEVGEITYFGTRYYAIVGYQADGHDVIVVEMAPPGRTLTQWVHDVDRRMRAGEDLG